MAGNGRYSAYAVKADATFIDQITSHSLTVADDVRVLGPLASIDPTVSLLLGCSPRIEFASTKVGTLLGAIGIDGLDVASAFEIGFVERSAGGAFEAAGEKISAAKCLVIPESLRAGLDALAEITYGAYPYSANGDTAPLAYANALPAGTPAVSEKFLSGAVSVGGVALGEVLSWSLAFGARVRRFKSAGHLYESAIVLEALREPVATIEVADMGELSTARLQGAEVAVVLNLKKLSLVGGGWQGSGDKSITITKAFLHISATRAAHPGDAGLTMTAQARKDGATAILVIA